MRYEQLMAAIGGEWDLTAEEHRTAWRRRLTRCSDSEFNAFRAEVDEPLDQLRVGWLGPVDVETQHRVRLMQDLLDEVEEQRRRRSRRTLTP
jgi:hypothetical protein